MFCTNIVGILQQKKKGFKYPANCVSYHRRTQLHPFIHFLCLLNPVIGHRDAGACPAMVGLHSGQFISSLEG